MRRLLALAVLLLPLAASAQRATTVRGSTRGPLLPKVVLNAPLNANGPLLAEGPGVVSHVYWDGRHNLALQSEAFETAPWVAYTTGTPTIGAPGVFPGSVLGPFGDPAARIAFDATANNTQASMMYQNVGALLAGRTYTVSVWLQAAQVVQQDVYLQITDFTAGNTGKTLCSAPVVGWSRCSVTHTRTNGNTSYITLGADSRVYSGQPVQGQRFVHVWGAQLNLDMSAPSTYVATTVAAITSVALDTGNLGWTMTGSVPAVQPTSSPFVPGKAGAGPFADTNFYTLGAASDPLDSTGDRYGCIVFTPTNLTPTQVLFVNGASGVAGYWIETVGGGAVRFISNTPTQLNTLSANASVLNAINVACWWRTGTSISIKLNLGTTATNASAGTEVAGTGQIAKVGRYQTASYPWQGRIYEIIQGLGACPAASCEAWATAQMRAVWSALTTLAVPFSVTRALDTATYTANGSTWIAPAGTLVTESAGASIWKASTNYVLQSSKLCSGTAVTAPWTTFNTTVQSQAGAPDGSLWCEATSATNLGSLYQTATTASSTTFSGKAAVAKGSGTAIAAISVRGGGAPSACSCTYTAGSCTTYLGTAGGTGGANDCTAKFTVAAGTPGVATVSGTYGAATTAPILILWPGDPGAAVGTAQFGLAQLEASAYATPYIPTAAAAVTRNATVATVPLSALGTRWCVAGTVTVPGTWSAASRLMLSAGVPSTANSFYLQHYTDGKLYFNVYNGAGSFKTLVSSSSSGFANGSTHRVIGCNNAGALSMCADGVAVPGTVSGGGDGIIASFPAALYLGQASSGFHIDGNVRDVKICRGATKCAACP